MPRRRPKPTLRSTCRPPPPTVPSLNPAAPSRDRTLTEDSRDDLAKPKQRSAPPKKKGGRGGGLERKGSTKSGSSSSDVSSRDSSVESNTDRRECGGAVVGPSVLGAQLTPYYVRACLACTAPLTPSPHLPSPLSTLRCPPSSLLPPSPPPPVAEPSRSSKGGASEAARKLDIAQKLKSREQELWSASSALVFLTEERDSVSLVYLGGRHAGGSGR